MKSLVWYVPEQFEEAGYEIPETMEDLKALTEQIAEDGGRPGASASAPAPRPAGPRPTGSRT